jgi:hypothetical protein
MIIGIVISVILFIIFIYNLVYGFRTIRGVGRARCAANSASNYIEHGGYLKSAQNQDLADSLYIGNYGIMNYLASFRSEISSLPILKVNMDTIINADIVTKSNNLEGAFTSFFQTYASKRVSSCSNANQKI